jgi:ABC-2 type transport system ATP-binding protein
LIMAKLVLKNVSLAYPIYNMSSRSIRSQLVSAATGGLARQFSPRSVVIDALRGIDLELSDGDRLGLVGPNGAGKSTLLRLLAGVYEASEGSVFREGVIETLFDLSLGIDMDASGYDNIRLMATIRGFNRDRTEVLAAEVAEFSELVDYLHFPVRTYSAGMVARLGFSIATAVKPEILLVDEVLGAGDQYFLRKATMRIRDIAEQTNILVLASHSNHMVRQFCNKCAIMKRGRIVEFGSVDEIMSRYETDVQS